MKLNRRYKRSIKDNLSFYVSSSVLTIVTLLLFYLFYIAGTGINAFGEKFFERNRLADAEFTTYLPITDDELADLEDKYGAELEAQSYINIEEDDYTARVFSRTEKINLYEITEGRDAENDGEIVISEGYAVYMNVKIGDTVTLKGKDYEVTGYFQRPDYLYMLEQTDDSYKNVSSFFLAYVSDGDFEELGDKPVMYFVRYKDADSAALRREINDSYITQSYLSADENTRITMVKDQADMFISMAYVLLVILPLITVALISIILGRKVKSEQKLIGTLTAMGYKKSALMRHYAGFAVIPGIFGGVLSFAVSFFCAQSFGEAGLTDYEPMRAEFTLPIYIGLLGIAVPTVMYVLAAVLSVGRLLKNDAVTMLNGAVGSHKRSKRFFAGSSMPVRKKYAFRSLLSNPARSLVVLLGVFLGSFIILFTFAMIDSIKAAPDQVLSQLGNYKYEYILAAIRTEEPDEGEAVIVAALEDTDGKSISVMGIDEDNPYVELCDENGAEVEIGDGYYISSYMSLILDVGEGDKFELYSPLDLEKTEIEISGVVENDMQCAVYMSRENAEGLLGFDSGAYNAIMSDVKLEFEESELTKTVDITTIRDQMDTIMSMMWEMIIVMAVLGAVICICAVYVSVNMMMTENRNNISMLKVLGYSDRRINAFVINANHILLIIGLAISIPALYFTVSTYFAAFAEMFGMMIDTVIKPLSYVYSIAFTSACYFISLYLIRRKTKRVDMVESLKDNRE